MDASNRKALLEARLAELQKQLERLENLPENPEGFDDGSATVSFAKDYGGSAKYTYVAHRPPGLNRWFLTNENSSGITWEELLDFMASGEKVMPTVWLVTEMEEYI